MDAGIEFNVGSRVEFRWQIAVMASSVGVTMLVCEGQARRRSAWSP
jgi:hypothetical protein